MTDLEKVFKGLTVCTKPGTKGCFYDLKECPYDENGCRMALMCDALALLKEQEKEIRFLKGMQLRTVKGMDEGELGRMVRETLRT